MKLESMANKSMVEENSPEPATKFQNQLWALSEANAFNTKLVSRLRNLLYKLDGPGEDRDTCALKDINNGGRLEELETNIVRYQENNSEAQSILTVLEALI